jgi:sporulation protein YlmC with PRC-barrel domain
MAEETELRIGAEASCTDGVCGEVSRMIIDPDTQAVTHLVIDPKHQGERGRLVPLDLVDTSAGRIRLRCTLAEFGQLEPAEETRLAEGYEYGGDYGPPASVHGYGGTSGAIVGGAAGNMGVSMGVPHSPRTFVQDVVPLGEAEVGHGEPVHALDGEIGKVHGFLVDPGDHRVTHVLLQEGHLWGRKEVAIPASAVTRVDEGIRLNLTKQQVEDLPPAD